MLAFAIRLPHLDQPLLERHAFRQTQTAYPALPYHGRGISLLHPLLPILGPPFEVSLEFALLQALGSLVMNLDVPHCVYRGLDAHDRDAVDVWGVLGYGIRLSPE